MYTHKSVAKLSLKTIIVELGINSQDSAMFIKILYLLN